MRNCCFHGSFFKLTSQILSRLYHAFLSLAKVIFTAHTQKHCVCIDLFNFGNTPRRKSLLVSHCKIRMGKCVEGGVGEHTAIWRLSLGAPRSAGSLSTQLLGSASARCTGPAQVHIWTEYILSGKLWKSALCDIQILIWYHPETYSQGRLCLL